VRRTEKLQNARRSNRPQWIIQEWCIHTVGGDHTPREVGRSESVQREAALYEQAAPERVAHQAPKGRGDRASRRGTERS